MSQASNQNNPPDRRVMGVLASSEGSAIAKCVEDVHPLPAWKHVRPPETGLVMVRGRIGGEGAAFNFGEVTVTRAAVSLDDGTTGFSYALGRDKKKAEQSALLHALWKTPARREQIEREVIEPLEKHQQNLENKTRSEVEPTKVDFFTLVRGDD